MALVNLYSSIKGILDGISSPYAINNTYTGRVYFTENNTLETNATATLNGNNVIEWWEIYVTDQSNVQHTTKFNLHKANFVIEGFFSFTLIADLDGSNNTSEVVFNRKVESVMQELGKSPNFQLGNNIDVRNVVDSAVVDLVQANNKLLHHVTITLSELEVPFTE